MKGNIEGGAYTILSYQSGRVVALHTLQKGEIPMMCASDDKLLVVTQQLTRASYMETGNTMIAQVNEILNFEG